jgi:hypothetical protein
MREKGGRRSGSMGSNWSALYLMPSTQLLCVGDAEKIG